MAERKGIEIPDFDGTGYDPDTPDAERRQARRELADFMARHKDGWIEVEDGAEQLFDGLLVNYGSAPIHVATVVAEGWALNIDRGCNVVLVRWREGEWASKGRVAGIYRHADLV